MYIKQEVSVQKVMNDAEAYFAGGYFCSEALMAAIRENFTLDVTKEVIALTSGMSALDNQGEGPCGALSSGIMVLGLLFGRMEQDGHNDPRALKCMDLSHELISWFRQNIPEEHSCTREGHADTCMTEREHKNKCMRATGLCAGKVAEIIIREKHLVNIDELELRLA